MVEHNEEIHLIIAGISETTTVVIEDNGGMNPSVRRFQWWFSVDLI